MQHLFVYGTLAPNQPNEHILAPINGIWQPATIRGKLYPNGWGATLGFPAVIPDTSHENQGEIVKGLVFSSAELDKHWQRIDDFEGEGYQRIEVETTLENGEKLTAFVYALHPKELK